MWEILPLKNEQELTQINENNVVGHFALLLENPEKKELIVVEVAKRIISLSPITHHDQRAIESWNPDYTTIDDMIWNSLWKFKVQDILFQDWVIFLKTFNIIYNAIHKTSISNEILLDIIRVALWWKESKITEKVPINEIKEHILKQIKTVLNNWG